MSNDNLVVGIDLGTTNSEIAAFMGDRVQILGPGNGILPSCVGLSSQGELLVGHPARNQQLLRPERTVRSIKRRMGSTDTVTLGDRAFSPEEISSFILRELITGAEKQLGTKVEQAVITVPAYFSDAQRNATREAGLLAGLQVARILNEPTAASLAYGFGGEGRRTVMIYDLGGGTFDVSVVTVEDDVTEVLASHGNNQLGGDDFDDLLLEHLVRKFQGLHGIDLRQGNAAAHARLRWAAEEAKKRLSFEPYARVLEENLARNGSRSLHLDLEISRDEYEDMIRPLVQSTLDSVSRTLRDASTRADDLDAIVLVGGSTRTPLVSRLLREKCGLEPHREIHPDLCVALGAAVLGSRLAGQQVDRVLVDVSPFSFGPSYLGMLNGTPYTYCYHPVIERNTPLPVTRTEKYYTAMPYQDMVQIEIFQGEDADALKNIPVGSFQLEELTPLPTQSEVLCRMTLDVDGILKVTATQKETGKSVHVTITNALKTRSAEEITDAQLRLDAMYRARRVDSGQAPGERAGGSLEGIPSGEALAEAAEALLRKEVHLPAARETPLPTSDGFGSEARALVQRSQKLLDRMHPDDMDEAIDLHERIMVAIEARDEAALEEARATLAELIFFVEGK